MTSRKFNRMSEDERRMFSMRKYNEQRAWFFWFSTKAEDAIPRELLGKELFICWKIFDNKFYEDVYPASQHV